MSGVTLPADCGCGTSATGLPCGCCEATAGLTPEDKTNAPALASLRYRVGRYATFRETMARRIPATPALKALTTRRDDDFAIALLDMWAYVGDVLTFYQERYANEAYLRTATQRDNVLRLAALLDHRPSPGAAAVAWLAFAADKDKQVTIPLGLRVQSVPGQDEKPQKFETIETVAADAALNEVRVFGKPTSHTALKVDGTRGVLDPRTAEATLARLKPGDRLVMVRASSGTDAGIEEKEVVEVDDDPLEPAITWSPPVRASGARMAKTTGRFPVFGATMPQSFVLATPTTTPVGYTFAKQSITYKESGKTLRLDGAFEGIPTGSRILVVLDATVLERTVLGVGQAAAEGDVGTTTGSVPPAGLSRVVTTLTLDADVNISSGAQNAVVYVLDGPDVGFATKAYPEPTAAGPAKVSGKGPLYVPLALLPDRPLGRAVDASAQPRESPPQPRDLLAPGRRIILDDERAQPILATVAKARLANVTDAPGSDHVELTLEEPLPRALDAATAYLRGNVAQGTHGETVKEDVLGDGDASRAFQRFTLSKSPLTFVPSPGAPGGVASTLTVSVNRVAWSEVDTLLLADGNDEVHQSRLRADGTTDVTFGDGEQGARVPTGRKNVTATYRVGLGKAGNVPADALRNALDKPVGLKGVTNPAMAEGGADAEATEAVREAAPGKVRTFSRIVSLRDFRDAALEYAGVTKAKATRGWHAGDRTVFLTVGGDPDAPLGPQTLRSLTTDLNARRDATARLVVQAYKEVPVVLDAVVVVSPRFVPEDVLAAARQALVDMLAYDARDFGQSVNLSDAYRVLQAVPGVVAARIDKLRYKREADRVPHGVPKRQLNPRLPVFGTELAALESPATDARVTRVPDLGDPLPGGDAP